MDILIKKSRMSSWNNKNEREESSRKFKKKLKTSRPWMGWFRYAGRVEILYVSRPFTTWKKGQVDWWIKLQKMYAIKEITEKQVIRWDNKQTKKIYHSSWFYGCQPIKSQISLFIISTVTQTRFMTWQVKLRYHLKYRDWKQVSIHKYTKSPESLTVMV